jgi:hypothetical protein
VAPDRFNCWKARAAAQVRGALGFDGGARDMSQDAFHYRPGAGSLAAEVAREARISEEIQRNPFCHIPPRLRVR